MMRIVTVKIPKDLLERLDKLIQKRLFSNRSQAIREALKMLIAHCENTIETLKIAWGEYDEEDD